MENPNIILFLRYNQLLMIFRGNEIYEKISLKYLKTGKY